MTDLNASQKQNDLLLDLERRGLIAQKTGEENLAEWLNSGSKTLYCGFDPTADSLHIGSLVPLLTLKRFQMAGHKPLALVGGATGLIGDPSFKSQERKLNSSQIVLDWVNKLKLQVSQFVDFDCGDNSAEVVNNLDWVGNLNALDFLRDVGKYFSVNNMIQKESVKQRIQREGEGISYTEFSYMLLQSYDFAKLYEKYSCGLQIGGSDQWGNITGGVDLSRRMFGAQVFGLTLPLVTKSDGTKFGKTESGTVWLDPRKTSPYAFHQFWLGTADSDVYKFLKYFTFLSTEDVDGIEVEDKNSDVRPRAQSVLADEVTRLVHGEAGLSAARRISRAMFNGEVNELAEADWEQLRQDGLPYAKLAEGDLEKPFTTLLSDVGMVKAGREVKDALARNAVFVNGAPKGAGDNMSVAQSLSSDNAFYGRFLLIKLGKKKNFLLEL